MDEHRLLEAQIQAINRFPDQNPNPVLRLTLDGRLTYANRSSAGVRRALRAEVGESVAPELFARLSEALASGGAIEVRAGMRYFSLLPVLVEDLGFINLYGTDVTAEKVIERFPNKNPNPVFRVNDEGQLIYANETSQGLTAAYNLAIGDRWPAEIAQRLIAAADAGAGEMLELEADHRTYALRPVRVPEFGFINVYGTDVTAEKVVAKFPNQNPNPVLRMTSDGTLIYANEASQPIVDGLGLGIGRILPAGLLSQLRETLAGDTRTAVEVKASGLVFELLAVPIPEFSFINLYGTDVTAAREVARAKQETERLLLNILPPPIAERLRAGEELIADRFEDASLLIADIVGFTELSSRLSADEIVRWLNQIFSRLDSVVERHGLEKIKTTGDAYMVIGGVPLGSADHLERLANFALDMIHEVEIMQHDLSRLVSFRMGIHNGPLVAGVIGAKRIIYDVWGDTVNLASRMESLGLPGRIHVTQGVQQRLNHAFLFEPRGQIEVKGKGPMETFFLIERRSAAVSSARRR